MMLLVYAVVCFLAVSTDAQAPVRLVGGSSSNEGRVEVFYDGEWGTVCDDLWDDVDAGVVCRELGLGNSGTAVPFAEFGKGSGPIVLDDVSCAGSEASILDCDRACNGNNNCGHYKDAGVRCFTEGPMPTPSTSVRLVGGSSSFEGRVEVLYNEEWGTVCDDLWDDVDAGVVCRELGLGNSGTAVPLAEFGKGSGLIVLDDVSCAGSETSILDCNHAGYINHNCGHYKDAGVRCSIQALPIRLVGGSMDRVGRVELLYNGAWGTVCSDGWDMDDANVVCRSLGLGPALEAVSSAGFGEGSGAILLDEVDCDGTEEDILQCGNAGLGVSDCGHIQDAGVRCAQFPSETIRLVNGSVESEGRVELFYNGSWGTICNRGWRDSDAAVACQSLGYPTTGAAILFPSVFGEGTGDILLRYVACNGTETDLFQCRSSRDTQYCRHNEDVGVQCNPRSSVRLVDGLSDMEGRVEVLVNGEWGTVCEDNWNFNGAKIICRSLGLGQALEATYRAEFGEGTAANVYKFRCRGDESTIRRCGRPMGINNCRYGRNAGVRCYKGALAPVRIEDGPSTFEGRVEFFYHDAWRTICANWWGRSEANIVCRELGLGYADEPSGRYEGSGPGLPYLDELTCSGREASLVQCRGRFGPSYCGGRAGVTCYRSVQGGIRLTGGASSNEGRVEVNYLALWGTICDDGFDMNAANVVCRSLGLGPALEVVKYAGFGQGSWIITLDDVNCTGSESNIYTCGHNGLGVSDCAHGEDVGVRCSPSELGSIRLANGSSETEGRVEVFYDGQWGTVCDDLWDDTDAGVVCEMLGMGTNGTAVTLTAEGGSTFGEGTGRIIMDNVECVGNETNIFDCPSNSPLSNDCVHAEDAGVRCLTTRTIRLVDGPSSSEGRVEILYNGTWGTVCDDQWDMIDAYVACRELGFHYALERITDGGFGGGTGPVVLDDVMCSGLEPSIVNCLNAGLGNANCGHREDAGVRCSRTSTPIRLRGGRNGVNEGRVEVFFGGQWGTVCHHEWDGADATVVCRQLGLNGTRGVAFDYAEFGEGSGEVLLDNVRCEGDETDIMACRSKGPLNNDCLHFQDAGVRCVDV